MPRGGRGGSGGRGGGREGAGAGGGGGGGGHLPWAYDADIQPDYKPSDLFPPVEQAGPIPLTRTERLHVARYRAFRDRVHEGPLYTVLGDHHRVGRRADAFDGMPTYTQKYRKKIRRLPKLDTRPYVLEFFPGELWSTLDPDHAKVMDVNGVSRKKKLFLSRVDQASHLLDDDDLRAKRLREQLLLANNNDDDHHQQQQEQQQVDDGKGADDDGTADKDEDADEEDDEERQDEEEVDDDFEADDDDMGGDYNAQNYYEEGADDFGGDDYGAGGGTGADHDEGGYL